MGIAVPTQFVSTNDLVPAKNSLSTIFVVIDPDTGALPESGPPLNAMGSGKWFWFISSSSITKTTDTYQAWTLIGVYNYYIFSGDIDWLRNVWHNYTLAVTFLENKMDDTGLMDVTGTGDWARLDRGGHDSEGNALLYKVLGPLTSQDYTSVHAWQVLIGSADLALYVNDTALAAAWVRNATNLKDKFNVAFWDASQGMYTDNTTTTLAPQDGNSLAVLFNLTTSPSQAVSISKGLKNNWNELGAVSPEVPNTISPFITGFEVSISHRRSTGSYG
jgi:glycogen debranching enzyme